MLRRAEEHAARNALPADAAVPPHEAEVNERYRQEEHDRGDDAGIVLLPPEGDADMEDTVRENETGRSEARPNEASVPPHGGEERESDEERVGAVDRTGREDEAARGSDVADHRLGVGN